VRRWPREPATARYPRRSRHAKDILGPKGFAQNNQAIATPKNRVEKMEGRSARSPRSRLTQPEPGPTVPTPRHQDRGGSRTQRQRRLGVDAWRFKQQRLHKVTRRSTSICKPTYHHEVPPDVAPRSAARCAADSAITPTPPQGSSPVKSTPPPNPCTPDDCHPDHTGDQRLRCPRA